MLTPYYPSAAEWSSGFSASRDKILAGLGRLGAGLPEPIREELASVLEIVNSYYSNAMEGNPTRVGQIFEAREGRLASAAPERDYQLEHLSHLNVSGILRARLAREPSLSPVDPLLIQELHRRFYSELPESMRTATMISGEKRIIRPGQWRDQPATVGLLKAVEPASIPEAMAELAAAYSPDRLAPRDALSALAAAHHRLLWVHPFPDGNGRVARLLTEAMALRLGFAGHHLYSISRGFARRRRDYDAALAAADAPRWNALDGRGNLSVKGLVSFCEFFADVMNDQIEFMARILEPRRLAERLEIQLQAWRAARRITASEGRVMLQLFRAGEIRRGDIQAAAGVERRQVSRIAARLLALGYAHSPSVKGPLRFRFHQELTRALLPEFFE